MKIPDPADVYPPGELPQGGRLRLQTPSGRDKLTFEFDRFRPHSLLPWIAAISRFHFQQKNRENIKFWPSYDYFSKIA